MIPLRHALGCAALLLACFAALAACDESSSSAVKEPSPTPGAGLDSGNTPSNDGGGNVSFDAGTHCFDNPKTHFEIINACTTATQITKTPALTKLLADGGLPPLQ